MSILIKGMEMPKNCYDCPFAMQDYTTLFGKNFSRTRNSYACVLTHKAITSTKRNRFCPLIQVPPHGRLIDADALIIALETQDYSCAPDTLEEWTPMDMTKAEIADIRNAPTIIPASEEGEG